MKTRIMIIMMLVSLLLGNNANANLNFSGIDQTDTVGKQQAINFQLQSIDNKEIKLSDFKGKKVMIHFWATWCPPCKWEMPALQQLYTNVKDDIVFLAINIDPQNDVAGFVEKYKLTFPVLLDETGEVNEAYSILSVPTTFLVSEEGMIEKKQIGAMTAEQMKEFLSN